MKQVRAIQGWTVAADDAQRQPRLVKGLYFLQAW
jgi:hypothetical protein